MEENKKSGKWVIQKLFLKSIERDILQKVVNKYSNPEIGKSAKHENVVLS